MTNNNQPGICHFCKKQATWTKIGKYGLRYYFCPKTTIKQVISSNIRAEQITYDKIIPCNSSKELI